VVWIPNGAGGDKFTEKPSYDVREPVEVRISPEDFVVLSYPGPDPSIRIEQLRAGNVAPRRYRNRRIGKFLKEFDLTEGRSRSSMSQTGRRSNRDAPQYGRSWSGPGFDGQP
jgi:hypothetical protein